MKKITFNLSINRLYVISVLLLSSLFMCDNAFSRNNWNGDFTKVTYDPTENSITFNFEVFDYHFGPEHENGYLRWCDFFYTTEARGVNNYTHLMRVETDDQGFTGGWTWLFMRYKQLGTQLQLLGCYSPSNGTMWPDNGNDLRVEVKNTFVPRYYSDLHENYPVDFNTDIAYFTVKWFLGDTYKDVKRIRLNGFWKVNGVYSGDNINNVYYDIPSRSMLKSNNVIESTSETNSVVNGSENNAVKVTKEADAIVIAGAKLGENIKVYTVNGAEVKSVVTNSDVVNIKLPENQIYIVNIGQARYKVAL